MINNNFSHQIQNEVPVISCFRIAQEISLIRRRFDTRDYRPSSRRHLMKTPSSRVFPSEIHVSKLRRPQILTMMAY